MWLRDTGVLGKMRDDELSAPMPIPDPKIKVDERISVEQLGIGIAIYSVGMTLSLLFFIGELCTRKRDKRVEKKQQRPRKTTLVPLYEPKSNNRRQGIIMHYKMGRQTVGHK